MFLYTHDKGETSPLLKVDHRTRELIYLSSFTINLSLHIRYHRVSIPILKSWNLPISIKSNNNIVMIIGLREIYEAPKYYYMMFLRLPIIVILKTC